MPSSGFWYVKKGEWYADFFIRILKWNGSLIWNRIGSIFLFSILSVKYYCHQAEENRLHKGKPQNTSTLFIDIFHYITCPMVWKYYYDYNAFFFFPYECKEWLSAECVSLASIIIYIRHNEARGFRYISVTLLVVSLLGFCTTWG